MTSEDAQFRDRRDRVRSVMGGAERIDAVHERGRRTIREHIVGLVDPDSFEEVGTFATSEVASQRDDTPGDGKIGGHATIAGRPVSVVGDDVTVKRGSSSVVGGRRVSRIYEQALRQGNPLVHLGETGGARVPDSLGSAGLATVSPPVNVAQRRRRIPMATIIVGESFGGSSFLSAMSDLVVQVRGTTMAVTSPRVIQSATGEQIGAEELGGVDVHASVTGQIDLVAETEEDAYAYVRQFLSYLPANSWSRAPVAAHPSVNPDPGLGELVPAERRRAYDMRRVIRRLTDGDWLELRPQFGRSILTGLARIGGSSVGLIASQPMQQAGVLTPDACDKAVRLICLCDAFDLPIVFLQDCPGFLVGQKVEHSRMLYKAILLLEAVSLARAPKLTIVLRKGFGLAYFTLGGNDMGTDLLCCWPSAEISLMDPEVGANVVDGAPTDVTTASMQADVGPWGAAGIMKVDEIIDPADTRPVLARALARLAGREPGGERPLASWPTCW